MDTTITAFLDYLQQVKKASANTIASYGRDLRCFSLYAKEMGVTAWSDVNKTIIMSFLYHLEKEQRSAATISRNMASLRSFFQYLIGQGRLRQNPAMGVEVPKVEKHIPQVLSAEEIACILAQPDPTEAKGARDLAMLSLLCSTGLRVSELIEVKCNDVSLAAGCLTCGDGQKERVIPLPSQTISALRLYLEKFRPMLERKGTYNHLFLNYTGQPMSRQGFWKLLKSYAKKAGIEKEITPQILRHSFAYLRLSSGCDLEVLRELLGHCDISSTLQYARIHLEQIKKIPPSD